MSISRPHHLKTPTDLLNESVSFRLFISQNWNGSNRCQRKCGMEGLAGRSRDLEPIERSAWIKGWSSGFCVLLPACHTLSFSVRLWSHSPLSRNAAIPLRFTGSRWARVAPVRPDRSACIAHARVTTLTQNKEHSLQPGLIVLVFGFRTDSASSFVLRLITDWKCDAQTGSLDFPNQEGIGLFKSSWKPKPILTRQRCFCVPGLQPSEVSARTPG